MVRILLTRRDGCCSFFLALRYLNFACGDVAYTKSTTRDGLPRKNSSRYARWLAEGTSHAIGYHCSTFLSGIDLSTAVHLALNALSLPYVFAPPLSNVAYMEPLHRS